MKTILIAGTATSLFAACAFAADLGVPPLMPAPPPSFTWTNCYAGLRAGGGWGEKDLTDTALALAPTLSGFTSANLGISGYMLGGQTGCNYQFAPNWVAGIEGSVTGGDIGGSTAVAITQPGAISGDNATFNETTDLLMSATGRIGYTWDRWMLYAKGGLGAAWDRYDIPGTFMGVQYDLQGSETRLGWTAGAGVEWAFSSDWSVKLEYDYYGFGQRNVTFVDQISLIQGPESIKQNIQVVTLGINLHISPW